MFLIGSLRSEGPLSLQEPWAELGGAAFPIMSKIISEKKSLQVADIAVETRQSVPHVISMLQKCFSYDPVARPTAVAAYEVLEAAIEAL